MPACATALDLDEVGRREDRPEHSEVENIGAIVTGGHHADGDADARLAGLVGGNEVAGAKQVVVGEIDREFLGIGNLRGNLHGEVRLILAGEHPVRHLVEDLRQLGGVVLADREDDRLADFSAHRVAQRVFEEGLAQKLVGGLGEEALLEFALLEGFLLVFAGVVGEGDDEAFLGQQFRGDVGARVDHRRIDQIALFDAVEQGVAESRLTVLAAEGAIGVEQQSSLGLARIARAGLRAVEAAQVIARGGGEAELVADKVVEDRACVAADRAVRFIGDDEIKIGRRKELLILVVEQQRLHGGDDDLGTAPFVAVFLVDDSTEVGRKQWHQRFSRLLFEFEAVDEEQHALCVARAQE